MKVWIASLLLFSFPKDDLTREGLARLEEHLALGAPIVQEHLTVWPVLTDRPAFVDGLRTLVEGQRCDSVRVREGHYDSCRCVSERFGDLAQAPRGPFTGNGAAGTGRNGTGAIVVENAGVKAVFVPAGTVVMGGYQDQLVTQDAVVPARCWASVETFPLPSKARRTREPYFRSMERMAPGNLRREAQFAGDAQGVSTQFASLAQGARMQRAVEDFSGLFDREGSKRTRFVYKLECEFAKLFQNTRAEWVPIGFAYALNGKPMGIRSYANPKLFRSQFVAHAKALSFEADLTPAPRWIATGVGSRHPNLASLFEKLAAAKPKLMSGSDSSRFEVRESDSGYGSTCYARLPNEKNELEWFVISRDWMAK